jgi:hypothetical protein
MAAEVPTRLFHRFPFVLIDRPVEVRPGASSALRLHSLDDALHEGLAGTTYAQSLLIEAMAQAAALFRRGGGAAGLRHAGGLPGRLFRASASNRRSARGLLALRAAVSAIMVRVAGRVTASGETLAEGEILLSLGDAPGE